MKVIHRDIVGAAIISKDNKVLLGQTAKSAVGVYSGSWVVPGGGIEEGESKYEALRREMLEETNIDIEPYKIQEVRTANGNSTKKLKDTGEVVEVEMTFYDYKVVIDDKNSKEIGNEPTEELQVLRWFSPDELKNEPVSAPTVDLLKAVGFIK